MDYFSITILKYIIVQVPALESLTQVIHESRADDSGSQSEQSGMNIEAAPEANPELAETSQPGMCALDDPTMTPEPLTALDTTAGNTGLDAALSQIAPATSEVILFVGVQFARPLTRLPVQARYRRNGIKRGLECHRIVPIGFR